MGEDLGTLSLKELQSLEQQLDTSVKLIRTRRVINYTYIIQLLMITI